MTVEIIESGITFGPFEARNVYQIERCAAATALGDGIKRVEFIVCVSSAAAHFCVVEAKASIPREQASFWPPVIDKFTHSLLVWAFAANGRHTRVAAALPPCFQETGWQSKRIRLVLVIPEAPDHLLPAFSDAFKKRAAGIVRASGITLSDVIVLNMQRARTAGLINAPN